MRSAKEGREKIILIIAGWFLYCKVCMIEYRQATGHRRVVEMCKVEREKWCI